jgi:hypothetical protein
VTLPTRLTARYEQIPGPDCRGSPGRCKEPGDKGFTWPLGLTADWNVVTARVAEAVRCVEPLASVVGREASLAVALSRPGCAAAAEMRANCPTG